MQNTSLKITKTSRELVYAKILITIIPNRIQGSEANITQISYHERQKASNLQRKPFASDSSIFPVIISPINGLNISNLNITWKRRKFVGELNINENNIQTKSKHNFGVDLKTI